MKREKKGRDATTSFYATMAAAPPADLDPAVIEKTVAMGYSEEELRSVPGDAVMALGCGNPTALADLREGETVLDLGSGGGLDAFLAARKVGPRGRVVGVDMTPEMVEKATANGRKGRFANVEFRVGEIERLPVEDATVDVVISNCVMNHCRDKVAAFAEALRVLRPGGRLHVADLVLGGVLSEALRRSLGDLWAGWLAAASQKQDYLNAIGAAGFRNVQIVSQQVYWHQGMDEGVKGKILSLQVRAYR